MADNTPESVDDTLRKIYSDMTYGGLNEVDMSWADSFSPDALMAVQKALSVFHRYTVSVYAKGKASSVTVTQCFNRFFDDFCIKAMKNLQSDEKPDTGGWPELDDVREFVVKHQVINDLIAMGPYLGVPQLLQYESRCFAQVEKAHVQSQQSQSGKASQ
ncbi:hypothetical protein MCC10043_0244 [Bifidobacterium longum subsp. longum]|jgi:hypothetical protein|uniref:Uncharacterized protein n=1 Tax=Bifidobacterium longum subsp. longum TaxID=1679 RepID=A0AB38IH33_BIFLL|nr:hypothetical protein MCC10017_0279 [Bifidobacterium longum subsp. longum]TCE42266.1 hypothetical protein MCC10043_0244 [Bifidobacterium longum subsp. longum]TCE53954.1 hypothetical protein MCC10048_0251 [Bifidobacterium longum subsp. longum]TCE82735.1 hypothetical protein MCC10068_0261 [Bifidobacterium longum subsp. longum]TCF22618.1 hypothetical protein MCC10090_0345 [Bifidobacterium longum subsp. longum]